MSWQTFWQVFVLLALILGAQGLFFSWLAHPDRTPEQTGTSTPMVRYIDRPLCAIDKTPITEQDPLKIEMMIDLLHGLSLPVTIYICQHCVHAALPLIPNGQVG